MLKEKRGNRYQMKRGMAWLLTVGMLFTLLQGISVKVEAKTDDGTGLVAAEWLEYDDAGRLILTDDGLPGFYDNGLQPVQDLDCKEVTWPGETLWLDYISEDGTRTHVKWTEIDVQYYGDHDPLEPDVYSYTDNRCTLLQNPRDPRLIDFTPKTTGWYLLSYTGNDEIDREKDLRIYVVDPDLAFYKYQPSSVNHKLEALACSGYDYTCDYYRGEDSDVYLHLYNSDNVTIELADGDPAKAEEGGDKAAFELRYYDDEGEHVLYGDETGIDDWFTVEKFDGGYVYGKYSTNCWYHLKFNDSLPAKNPGGETVDYFSIRVNAHEAAYQKTEEGEYDLVDEYDTDQWLHVICYNSASGIYVLSADDSYHTYAPYSLISAGVNPCTLKLSFVEINTETDEDNIKTITKENLDPACYDIMVERWDDETEKWSSIEEKFLKTNIEKPGSDTYYLELTFYQEGQYCLTINGFDFYVDAWLPILGFYDTAAYPNGDRPITTFLGRTTTVRQHETKAIHVTSWFNDADSNCADMSTVDIKAYDKNGRELNDYIRLGEWIKEGDRVIGRSLEITDKAAKDFEIRATATTIATGRDEDGTPVTFEPQKIEDSLYVNLLKLNSIKITTPPTKTAYVEGEIFDKAGMVVTGCYSDGSTALIEDYTVSKEALTVSDKKVTVTYFDKTVDCNITVTAGTQQNETPVESTVPAESPVSGGNAGTTGQNPATVPSKTAVEIGKSVEDSKTGSYKVTGVAEDGTLEVVYTPNKSAKKASKVTIKESVIIDGVECNVTALANNAFSGNKKLTKVNIPDTVTMIGKNAFKNCTKLKSVKLPQNLAVIESSAFESCKSLKKVTIKGSEINSIGKNAFKGIAKKSVIKVPKEKKTDYKKLLKKSGYNGTVK